MHLYIYLYLLLIKVYKLMNAKKEEVDILSSFTFIKGLEFDR